MIVAGILGFSVGAAIAWWGFLRQHSTAALKVWPGEEVWHFPDPILDPLDTVQTADPYVFALTVDSCE